MPLIKDTETCAISGLPIQAGREFWVIVQEGPFSREFLLSCHKTEAKARAKIRWIWRKKYPLTSLKIQQVG